MLFKHKISAEEKAEMVTAYLPSFPTIDAGKLADLPRFRGGREGDMELLLELFAFYGGILRLSHYVPQAADRSCSAQYGTRSL